LSGQKAAVHDSILIEFYSHENPFPWTANLDYRIVRMGPYKYIRWIRFAEDMAELYDLAKDPYEIHSVLTDPNLNDVLEGMKADMRRLVLISLGLDGGGEK
jgi:N-acetylglucosamine-6-sulfatase